MDRQTSAAPMPWQQARTAATSTSLHSTSRRLRGLHPMQRPAGCRGLGSVFPFRSRPSRAPPSLPPPLPPPAPPPAGPPPDRRQAGRAKLVLGGGRLTYGWRRGAATARADLGDPIRGDTGYALCLYDAPGETPAGKLELLAPPESLCAAARCWRPTDRGLTFTDEERTPGRLGRL